MIQEVLECYIKASHTPKQLDGHVPVACICIYMAHILLCKGCILEASYVNEMAKCANSTLEADNAEGEQGHYPLTAGCVGAITE
jgi:hypothetical protein